MRDERVMTQGACALLGADAFTVNMSCCADATDRNPILSEELWMDEEVLRLMMPRCIWCDVMASQPIQHPQSCQRGPASELV